MKFVTPPLSSFLSKKNHFHFSFYQVHSISQVCCNGIFQYCSTAISTWNISKWINQCVLCSINKFHQKLCCKPKFPFPKITSIFFMNAIYFHGIKTFISIQVIEFAIQLIHCIHSPPFSLFSPHFIFLNRFILTSIDISRIMSKIP